jgi:hypothetical protein
MSPFSAPARTFHAPASAGRARLAAGGIATIATIITTGTGTTGYGWVSARE